MPVDPCEDLHCVKLFSGIGSLVAGFRSLAEQMF